MNTDHLIKMANEISAFFNGESGADGAPKDVAAHMKKFWEPRMRREIVSHYEKGAAGLNDIARKAVGLLAAEQPR